MERGTEPFFESMLPKLIGKTTHRMRPDLVEGALRMMRKMSPQGVASVQRGMAERPDSVETLKTINVPTLILTGDEDILTGTGRGRVDAAAHSRQPDECDSQGRALFSVGAAGGSGEAGAGVSGHESRNLKFLQLSFVTMLAR